MASIALSVLHGAARAGAQVRQVSLYDMPTSVSVGKCVARLKVAVTAATRIVAVTWVHLSTGVKLPIHALADLIDEINRRRSFEELTLLCVDEFSEKKVDPNGLKIQVFSVLGGSTWAFICGGYFSKDRRFP